MIYRLCYVDPDEPKAYFTSNWEKQWGDDWNDRPYEHNAGAPYTDWYEDGISHPIKQKIVYFDLPVWYETPCSNTDNSKFSVQDINNNRVAWISYDGTYIFAGTTYSEFCRKIQSLGGTIYTPKGRVKK